MGEHKDHLTGLPDRVALGAALERGMMESDGVALAVLDLDRLMELNADLGSEAGDRLLQGFAGILSEEAPGKAYRLSGDEFALVLPGLSLEQAFLKAEMLRARVQGSAARFGFPGQREVTVTAGVAQYPRDAKDVQGLLKAADAALGAAKESGRNQVGLPPNEDMVMKSCYYPAAGLRKLKALAERLGRKESYLLREALNDLLRKYDIPRET